MIYKFGTKIKMNLKIVTGLRKIYGIGRNSAVTICNFLGFLPSFKIGSMVEKDWEKLAKLFQREVEAKEEDEKIGVKGRYILTFKHVQQREKVSITNLMSIKTYKGLRHKYGLPVRGQRTHSNAKTQKRIGFPRLNRIKRYYSSTKVKVPQALYRHVTHLINTGTLPKPKLRKPFRAPSRKRIKKLNKIKKVKVKVKRDKNNKIIVKKKKDIKRNGFYTENSGKTFNTIVLILKFSNSMVFLYNRNKNLYYWLSGGSIGLKGKNKSSFYGAAQMGNKVSAELAKRRIKNVRVLVRGIGPSRKIFLRKLRKNKLRVKSITDGTKIPHNGCRKKKLKR